MLVDSARFFTTTRKSAETWYDNCYSKPAFFQIIKEFVIHFDYYICHHKTHAELFNCTINLYLLASTIFIDFLGGEKAYSLVMVVYSRAPAHV